MDPTLKRVVVTADQIENQPIPNGYEFGGIASLGDTLLFVLVFKPLPELTGCGTCHH